MAEIVQQHDFVEVDYTGKVEGKVFDTTLPEMASYLPTDKPLKPLRVCVGERQLLPGLDEALIGKEIGTAFEVTLPPEKAFGKRDIKKIRIIPASTFKEHKVDPHPGLQVQVDGEMGVITGISGGRILVNFNHPLAGKEIKYTCTLRRKITAPEEQVRSYLQAVFSLPEEQIQVTLREGKVEVSLPKEFPSPVAQIICKRLSEVVKREVIITSSRPQTPAS